MFNQLIALIYILFIVGSCVTLFFVALFIWLVTYFFDRRLVFLHYFTSCWAYLYVWLMPAWRVCFEGRQNIQKKPYIIVSNHQSLLDILVIYGLFFPFKWVSKIEIFKIPFIGWNMYLNKYIGLQRGDRQSSEDMFKQAAGHVRQGSSVYFFPEGTRSKTGELRPFKVGAFLLAKKLRVPILPIMIDGTKNALPKHSLSFHGKHSIRVKVLPEIEPDAFTDKSPEQLAEYVRELIEGSLLH